MLKGFVGYLYGNIPARLRVRTKRSVFSSLFRQAAVGPVTESRVRLQRVIPLFGNSFKPIFVGMFQQHHGRVVLEGRFTTFLFAKVLLTTWLGFIVVWTIVAIVFVLKTAGYNPGKLSEEPMTLLSPVVGVAFFVAGVAFARLCWWLSRKDILFLAAVIHEALSRGTSNFTIERPH